MTVHELKCWPESFAALVTGAKRFEWRRDDRGYEVGDVLNLREWRWDGTIPAVGGVRGAYTGNHLRAVVTHILRDAFDVPPGFVVMSIAPAALCADMSNGCVEGTRGFPVSCDVGCVLFADAHEVHVSASFRPDGRTLEWRTGEPAAESAKALTTEGSQP